MEIKRETAKITLLENELEKSTKIGEPVLNNVAKLKNRDEEGDTYSTIIIYQVRKNLEKL